MNTTDERILTPREVAEWMAARGMVISVERITSGIRANEFPGHRVGNRYLVPLPWLSRWLNGPAEIAPQVPSMAIPMLHRKAS